MFRAEGQFVKRRSIIWKASAASKSILSAALPDTPTVIHGNPLNAPILAYDPTSKPRALTKPISKRLPRITGPCRETSMVCKNEAKVKGLCWTHYTRQLRLAKLEAGIPEIVEECSVEGCNKPMRAKKFCWSHYSKELKQRKQNKIGGQTRLNR